MAGFYRGTTKAGSDKFGVELVSRETAVAGGSIDVSRETNGTKK
jgi:hypothetical protein